MTTGNIIWSLINSVLIVLITFIGNFIVKKKLEKLKSSLSKERYIHKVQFEKEFDIYQNLWKELVALRRSIFTLFIPNYLFVPLDSEAENNIEVKKLERFRTVLEKATLTIEDYAPFYSQKVFEYSTEMLKLSRKLNSIYHEIKDPEEQYKKTKEKKEEMLSLINNIEKVIRDRIGNMGEAKLIG